MTGTVWKNVNKYQGLVVVRKWCENCEFIRKRENRRKIKFNPMLNASLMKEIYIFIVENRMYSWQKFPSSYKETISENAIYREFMANSFSIFK